MPGAAPVKFDLNKLRKANQAALKKLENGGSAPYLYAMSGNKPVLVIGKAELSTRHALLEANAFSGTVTVTKGSLTDPGQLRFTGVAANRHELEVELRLFTKKRIVFA